MKTFHIKGGQDWVSADEVKGTVSPSDTRFLINAENREEALKTARQIFQGQDDEYDAMQAHYDKNGHL
jgi:hypothetical protein